MLPSSSLLLSSSELSTLSSFDLCVHLMHVVHVYDAAYSSVLKDIIISSSMIMDYTVAYDCMSRDLVSNS